MVLCFFNVNSTFRAVLNGHLARQCISYSFHTKYYIVLSHRHVILSDLSINNSETKIFVLITSKLSDSTELFWDYIIGIKHRIWELQTHNTKQYSITENNSDIIL